MACPLLERTLHCKRLTTNIALENSARVSIPYMSLHLIVARRFKIAIVTRQIRPMDNLHMPLQIIGQGVHLVTLLALQCLLAVNALLMPHAIAVLLERFGTG